MRARDRAQFDQRVGGAIAELERHTAAEVVVVVVPQAESYADLPLLGGVAALVATLAVVVFVETEVGDYTLLAAPVAAFVAAALTVRLVRPLQRALAGRARRARGVDVLARATFQKAGLARTRDATAVLVFLSELERACVIVRDHGAARALPDATWAAHEAALSAALTAGDPTARVVEALGALGEGLAATLPPRPDDVDELPSRITVSFP